MSLFAEIFIQHQFAPGDPDYRFTGLMTANYQAMNLLMFLFCSLTLLLKRPRWTAWIACGMAVALALLFITRSRLSTAIGIVLLAAMLTRIARQRMRAQGRALVIVLILAVTLPPLTYVLANNEGEGAAMGAFMMGRTDTENTSNLSNRAPLWSELWESVEERPWTVPHAHNTYLDQTLSLGFPGALLYLISVWGAAIVAWRRHHRARSAESLLPAVVLTWLALTGIAESVPLDPYLPTMIAYTCAIKMMMLEGSEAATSVQAPADAQPLVLSDGPQSLEVR
jgi:O-antigen ligase